MAFEAVDVDNSDTLDKPELSTILKSVANAMKIPAPTDNDVDAVLSELDADQNEGVSAVQFEDLIMLVLRKMQESELEL